MTSNQKEHIELAIWKELASENLSVSHDRWHIDRVLSFAYQLQSIYGGDSDVITAAVIMHDLGREDPNLHGQDSIEKSIAHARRILGRIGLPLNKVEQVITAIDEHDKPEIRPSTIEGRILKDADFLGGFGAWGILRICMWAGETGGRIDQILDRLEHRMPKRLENLEFIESERWARSETLFTHLFLTQLKQVPSLTANERKGKYIVLEGVSGTGKDTQVDILRKRLAALDYNTVLAFEPAEVYEEFRNLWENEHDEKLDDPVIRRFLLIADRWKLIVGRVRPALENGSIVLSARSFISFLVYQCHDENDVAAMAFAHQFVPIPDLIVLYDLDADEAFRRINGRKGGRSRYEEPHLLKMHRDRYLAIVKSGLFSRRFKVIDACKPIDEAADDTWRAVELAINEGR